MMTMDVAAVRLLLELGKRGWRGPITDHVLAELALCACDQGIRVTCDMVEADPGWLVAPSKERFGYLFESPPPPEPEPIYPDEFYCEACGAPQAFAEACLGVLGTTMHFRCRYCGMESSSDSAA
jgi:hypothetical protein